MTSIALAPAKRPSAAAPLSSIEIFTRALCPTLTFFPLRFSLHHPNVFSSHVLSYGQFSRVVCDQFLLLSQGDVSITLTASGAGGEAFSDLALLSVELESEDVRKAM